MVSYPGTIPGNASVGGNLAVTGNATVTGTVNVTGGVINLGADVNIYRNAGNLQTDDYFVMPNGQTNTTFTAFGADPKALSAGTVGGGFAVKQGANGREGRATLVAGTVTVANTSVTAATDIFLTSQVDGGTPGWLRVSARVVGTSFTITSSNVADTSTVAWLMVEPA
jgi:hypothetical protein